MIFHHVWSSDRGIGDNRVILTVRPNMTNYPCETIVCRTSGLATCACHYRGQNQIFATPLLSSSKTAAANNMKQYETILSTNKWKWVKTYESTIFWGITIH